MNGMHWKCIVGALERRLVAIPGELAGYLVLGIVDALGEAGGHVDPEDIELLADGRLRLRRVGPISRDQGERNLRRLLAEILHFSSSQTPGLLRAAGLLDRGDGRSVSADLHAALIPVNRSAARRALARLHRELGRIAPQDPGQQSDGMLRRAAATKARPPALPSRGIAANRAASMSPAAAASRAAEPLEAPLRQCTAVDSSAAVPLVEVAPPAAVAPRAAVVPPVAALAPVEVGGGAAPVVGQASAAGLAKPNSTFEFLMGEIPDLEAEPLASVVGGTDRRGRHGREQLTPRAGAWLPPDKGPPVESAATERREEPLKLELTVPIAPIMRPSGLDPASPPQAVIPAAHALGANAAPRTITGAVGSLELPAAQEEATFRLPAVKPCAPVERTERIVLNEMARVAAESYEPSIALPLVQRRLADRALDPRPEPEDWAMTSLDAVIEVSDDEIIYEETVWENLDAESADKSRDFGPNQLASCVLPSSHGGEWSAVDDSSDEELQPALVHPLESANGACGAAELPTKGGAQDSSGHLSMTGTVPPCGEPEDEWGGSGLAPLAGSNGVESPVQVTAMAADPHAVAVRAEPQTVYRDPEVLALGPRSTVEALSEQFAPEPSVSEVELCRNLRHLAGVHWTPTPPLVLTHTPPPTVETLSNQRLVESNEPTRRLRRIATTVAVAGVIGIALSPMRLWAPAVAAAPLTASDALEQICRATVAVSNVDSGQEVRVRQTGDAAFRGPTSFVGSSANFSGLRCREDVELLVDDRTRLGLRRIPISGDRLTPTGVAARVRVDVKLDGPN